MNTHKCLLYYLVVCLSLLDRSNFIIATDVVDGAGHSDSTGKDVVDSAQVTEVTAETANDQATGTTTVEGSHTDVDHNAGTQPQEATTPNADTQTAVDGDHKTDVAEQGSGAVPGAVVQQEAGHVAGTPGAQVQDGQVAVGEQQVQAGEHGAQQADTAAPTVPDAHPQPQPQAEGEPHAAHAKGTQGQPQDGRVQDAHGQKQPQAGEQQPQGAGVQAKGVQAKGVQAPAGEQAGHQAGKGPAVRGPAPVGQAAQAAQAGERQPQGAGVLGAQQQAAKAPGAQPGQPQAVAGGQRAQAPGAQAQHQGAKPQAAKAPAAPAPAAPAPAAPAPAGQPQAVAGGQEAPQTQQAAAVPGVNAEPQADPVANAAAEVGECVLGGENAENEAPQDGQNEVVATQITFANINLNAIGFADHLHGEHASHYLLTPDDIYLRITPVPEQPIGAVVFGNQIVPKPMAGVTRTLSYTNKFPLTVVRIEDRAANSTSTIYFEQEELYSARFVLRDDANFIIPENRSDNFMVEGKEYVTFDPFNFNANEVFRVALHDGTVLFTNNPNTNFCIGRVKIGEMLVPINISSQYTLIKVLPDRNMIELYTTGGFGEHLIRKFRRVNDAFVDVSQPNDMVPWIPNHFLFARKIDFSIPLDLFENNNINVPLPQGVNRSVHVNPQTGNVDSAVFFLNPMANRANVFGNINFHKLNFAPFAFGIIHSILVERIHHENVDAEHLLLQVTIIASYGPAGAYNAFVFTPSLITNTFYRLETDFRFDINDVINGLGMPQIFPGSHYTEAIYRGAALENLNIPRDNLKDPAILVGPGRQALYDALNKKLIMTNREVDVNGAHQILFDVIHLLENANVPNNETFDRLNNTLMVIGKARELYFEIIKNVSSKDLADKLAGLKELVIQLRPIKLKPIVDASYISMERPRDINKIHNIYRLSTILTSGIIHVLTFTNINFHERPNLLTHIDQPEQADNLLEGAAMPMDNAFANLMDVKRMLAEIAYLQIIGHMLLVPHSYNIFFPENGNNFVVKENIEKVKYKAELAAADNNLFGTDKDNIHRPFLEFLIHGKFKESLLFIEGLIAEIKSHSFVVKEGENANVPDSIIFDAFDEFNMDQTIIDALVAPLLDIKAELVAINAQNLEASQNNDVPEAKFNLIFNKVNDFLKVTEARMLKIITHLVATSNFFGNENYFNVLPEHLIDVVVDLNSENVPNEVLFNNGIYKLKDEFRLSHKMVPALGDVPLQIPHALAAVQINVGNLDNGNRMASVIFDDLSKLTLGRFNLSDGPALVGMIHPIHNPLVLLSSIFVRMGNAADGTIEGYLDLNLNARIGNFFSALELNDLVKSINFGFHDIEFINLPRLKVLALKFGNQLVDVNEAHRTFVTFDENLNFVELTAFHQDGSMRTRFFARDILDPMIPFDPNVAHYTEFFNEAVLNSPWIPAHAHNKRLVDFNVPLDVFNNRADNLPRKDIAFSVHCQESHIVNISNSLSEVVVLAKPKPHNEEDEETTDDEDNVNVPHVNLSDVLKKCKVETIHFYIDDEARYDAVFGKITIDNLILPPFSVGFIHSIFIEKVNKDNKNMVIVGIITNYGPSGDYELLKFVKQDNGAFTLMQGPEVTADYIHSGLFKHRLLARRNDLVNPLHLEANFNGPVHPHGFMRPHNKIVTLFYTKDEDVKVTRLYPLGPVHDAGYAVYGAFPLKNALPNPGDINFVFPVLNSMNYINELFNIGYNALIALKVRHWNHVDNDFANLLKTHYSKLSREYLGPHLATMLKLLSGVMLKDAPSTANAVRVLNHLNYFVTLLNQGQVLNPFASGSGDATKITENFEKLMLMVTGFLDGLDFVLDEFSKNFVPINKNEKARDVLTLLLVHLRYINHLRNLVNGIHFEKVAAQPQADGHDNNNKPNHRGFALNLVDGAHFVNFIDALIKEVAERANIQQNPNENVQPQDGQVAGEQAGEQAAQPQGAQAQVQAGKAPAAQPQGEQAAPAAQPQGEQAAPAGEHAQAAQAPQQAAQPQAKAGEQQPQPQAPQQAAQPQAKAAPAAGAQAAQGQQAAQPQPQAAQPQPQAGKAPAAQQAAEQAMPNFAFAPADENLLKLKLDKQLAAELIAKLNELKADVNIVKADAAGIDFEKLFKFVEGLNRFMKLKTFRLIHKFFPLWCNAFFPLPDHHLVNLDVDITKAYAPNRVAYHNGRFTIEAHDTRNLRYTLAPIFPGRDLSMLAKLPIHMITVASHHHKRDAEALAAHKVQHPKHLHMTVFFRQAVELLNDLNEVRLAHGNQNENHEALNAAFDLALNNLLPAAAKLEENLKVLGQRGNIKPFNALIPNLNNKNAPNAGANRTMADFDRLYKAVFLHLHNILAIFPGKDGARPTLFMPPVEYKLQLEYLNKINPLLVILGDLISGNFTLQLDPAPQAAQGAQPAQGQQQAPAANAGQQAPAPAAPQAPAGNAVPNKAEKHKWTLVECLNNGYMVDFIERARKLLELFVNNGHVRLAEKFPHIANNDAVFDPALMLDRNRHLLAQFLDKLIKDINNDMLPAVNANKHKAIIQNICNILVEEIVRIVDQTFLFCFDMAKFEPFVLLEPIDIDILSPRIPEHVKFDNGVFRIIGDRKMKWRLRPMVGNKALELPPNVAVFQVSVVDNIINVFEHDELKIAVEHFNLNGDAIRNAHAAVELDLTARFNTKVLPPPNVPSHGNQRQPVPPAAPRPAPQNDPAKAAQHHPAPAPVQAAKPAHPNQPAQANQHSNADPAHKPGNAQHPPNDQNPANQAHGATATAPKK